MAGRRTNLALGLTLAVAFGSGVLSFAVGAPTVVPVAALHGAAGLALTVLVRPKTAIVRRGLRRRGAAQAWPSLVLGVLSVACVGSGVAHTVGITAMGPATAMQVHVGTALAVLFFAAAHVRARPAPPLRTDFSRRALLRTGGLAGAAAATWAATEGVVALAGARGAARRFTGSHETGSGDPAAMPVTQWLDDRVPSLDPALWRLTVDDSEGPRVLTLDDLTPAVDRVVATLDCTGGWFARQEWSGVALARLLGDTAGARSLLVTSATGYSRRLPLGDLPHMLLATHVGGRALSAGHGFPARLVVPGRRGFWWVKWVTGIRTDPLPAWAQLPFPLT